MRSELTFSRSCNAILLFQRSFRTHTRTAVTRPYGEWVCVLDVWCVFEWDTLSSSDRSNVKQYVFGLLHTTKSRFHPSVRVRCPMSTCMCDSAAAAAAFHLETKGYPFRWNFRFHFEHTNAMRIEYVCLCASERPWNDHWNNTKHDTPLRDLHWPARPAVTSRAVAWNLYIFIAQILQIKSFLNGFAADMCALSLNLQRQFVLAELSIVYLSSICTHAADIYL